MSSLSDAATVAADQAKLAGTRDSKVLEQIGTLQSRLRNRPRDINALKELRSALYAIHDYATAAEVAQRAIDCADFSGDLYVKLGRCLFRKWPQWKQISDIQGALAAYTTAMTDKNVNRQSLVYLELVSIHCRLGKYQDAMDTLGAFMVVFKEDVDFLMISQYNVAIILCLAGRFDEAIGVCLCCGVCAIYLQALFTRFEDIPRFSTLPKRY